MDVTQRFSTRCTIHFFPHKYRFSGNTLALVQVLDVDSLCVNVTHLAIDFVPKIMFSHLYLLKPQVNHLEKSFKNTSYMTISSLKFKSKHVQQGDERCLCTVCKVGTCVHSLQIQIMRMGQKHVFLLLNMLLPTIRRGILFSRLNLKSV